MPRVPWVSLLSQASTYPPRFWPNVIASRSTATVLPAPPFGLTTVTCRNPPKLRRTISTSCLYSSSCLPGASLTRPIVPLRNIARAPIVAVGSAGFASRRRANSSAVGVPSATHDNCWYGSTGGGCWLGATGGCWPVVGGWCTCGCGRMARGSTVGG
jgi:hypothetical protein